MTHRLVATVLAAAALLATRSADAQTFDFDATPFGTVPFSVTSGGVTATFTSPSSGFEILDAGVFPPGTVAGLSGRFVGAVNADLVIEPLTIDFDRPLGALSLGFALFDVFGAVDFSLEAFLGGASVGSASFTGTFPPGIVVPEGVASFNGAAFDRVVLTSTAADFGIDALTVASVPEPGTGALVGGGALLLGAALRRRARR